MRKLAIWLTALLVLALVLGGVGCGDGSDESGRGGRTSGPEAAARNAVQALEELDVDKAADYWSTDDSKSWAETVQAASRWMDSIQEADVLILDSAVIAESDDKAVVSVTARVSGCQIPSNSETYCIDSDVESALYMSLKDGVWLVDNYADVYEHVVDVLRSSRGVHR